MDLISSTQLSDYEFILQKINSEQERYEQLQQQLEDENNRIIAFKLSKNNYKISFITVMIFDEMYEIFNLYENDLKSYGSYLQEQNCKYALVEIYLTDVLLSKLSINEWVINISIKNSDYSRNKSVNLSQKSPILEIIPLGDNCYNHQVVVDLFAVKSKNIINLGTINVDISYYFDAKQKGITFFEEISKIPKLYNYRHFETPKVIQTEFKCNFDKSEFISAIIKNSYHKLDLETFSKFSDEEEILKFYCFVDNKKIVFSYNLSDRLLKIRCDPRLMGELKNYFQSFDDLDGRISGKIEVLLKEKSRLNTSNVRDVLKFYKKIREIWL